MGEIKTEPKQIFDEYKSGTEFKDGFGEKGIFEQSKINERFYFGDHWHGANTGNTRPLVRRPLIKRIADYKISSVTSAPISVNFSADGIPDNTGLKEQKEEYRNNLLEGMEFQGETNNAEIGVILEVLSDYFATTAERVKFDIKKETLLRNAYISGTAVAYTYWDSGIITGLYADEGKKQLIKGDIAFEILNVENIVFGDPNLSDCQSQPYIIISQRLDCAAVKREAKKNGIKADEIEKIKPEGKDTYKVNAGTYGETEQEGTERITVLTKFYKEWNDEGTDYKVMCVKATEKAYVKEPFDIGIKLYPLAVLRWNDRFSCAYGDSDITFQIPNQIAVNRAFSMEIWGIITNGMPLTVVNGDTVTDKITNSPGQVIKVYGTNEDVAGAVRHIPPPAFSGPLINAIENIASATLEDNGATEAALGSIKPDNAAAIIQTREAALQPMQLYQNKFYGCVEDIARIWAEFWLNLYGDRSLKITDESGSYYVPFKAERYKELLINAKVDVGSSPIYSVPASVATLDAMYGNQLIDKLQYLERMPDGIIKDKSGLVEAARQEKEAIAAAENAMAAGGGSGDIASMLAEQYPDIYEQFNSLSPEEQQAVLGEG